MKKLVLSLFCAVALIPLCSAQWYSGKALKGDGNVQTDTRQPGSFDAISVKSGLDVYIHQGNEEKIEIKTDANLIPHITTEVDGGNLVISTDKKISWNNKSRIDVWTKNLTKVSASGGSDVYSVGTINASKLGVHANGGADIKMSIQVDHLECHANGGADADLSGSANMMEVHVSGGADLKAYDLNASRCEVHASGGSDAYVQVSDEISINASGGSDIHYRGKAKVISQKVSGSADVHH